MWMVSLMCCLPFTRLSGLCDGPLSLSECHSSLLGMALRKTPGCDGLPAEFYLKFWDVLGADRVEVLNFCY